MSRPSQSRSQTAPLPDASIPRLRSPQPPARANPCCTACPSHPPDSAAKMESAFAPQENPFRLTFWGMCSSITVPTITMEGDANGAPHPDPGAYAKKFSGRYAHRTITGGIGHNLPQEAPQAFAEAVVDVAEI